MHLVEILLPLFRNDGTRQPTASFSDVRRELVEKFGGLTAFTRNPAEGLWEDDGALSRDEIVIFEVMAEELERGWWSKYRLLLETRFGQEIIVIRAREITMI